MSSENIIFEMLPLSGDSLAIYQRDTSSDDDAARASRCAFRERIDKSSRTKWINLLSKYRVPFLLLSSRKLIPFIAQFSTSNLCMLVEIFDKIQRLDIEMITPVVISLILYPLLAY